MAPRGPRPKRRRTGRLRAERRKMGSDPNEETSRGLTPFSARPNAAATPTIGIHVLIAAPSPHKSLRTHTRDGDGACLRPPGHPSSSSRVAHQGALYTSLNPGIPAKFREEPKEVSVGRASWLRVSPHRSRPAESVPPLQVGACNRFVTMPVRASIRTPHPPVADHRPRFTPCIQVGRACGRRG
jgi:hypothetical protein